MGADYRGYRPDIDGLRAVAVLAVITFHYEGYFLPGGFTGVDVFFVISGFLITQQIYSDVERGEFSILAFYDRRIKRIVPALVVVLVASLIAGQILLTPGAFTALGGSAGAAALGGSNFYFLFNTGYFDQSSELMPLLHTWSLAVEEQFYLFWPPLLLMLGSLINRRHFAAVVCAIVVIGFVVSLWWLDASPKGAFYMALPRAWELAIGAALVFLPAIPRALSAAATILGLAIIATGMLTVKANSFPGVYALLPCVGGALIVWPKRTETIASKALGLFSPIGLISYSLYLWHWPVLVYFRIYINDGRPTPGESACLFAASLALAALTYFLVEQPLRRRKWAPALAVKFGIASCLAIFCWAMFVHSDDGMPSRIAPERYAVQSFSVMWEWPCNASSTPTRTAEQCYFGKPWESAATKAVLWGDSHAKHMAPILEAAALKLDIAFDLYTYCPAIFGGDLVIKNASYPDYENYCRKVRAEGVQRLKEDLSINLVILATSWAYLPRPIAGSRIFDDPSGLARMKGEFIKFIKETRAPGRRFIIIGSVPLISAKTVECGNGLGFPRRQCDLSVLAPLRSTVRTGATDKVIADVADEVPEVDAIFPTRKLCEGDRCDLYEDGVFIYANNTHIRRNLPPETRKMLADRIGISSLLKMEVSKSRIADN